MATGTVKWFNNAKGYGFVLAQETNEDLFIHYSSIQMDGYKSLKAGQEIQYDVQEGPKGLHAVNIRYAEGQGPIASAPDNDSSQDDDLHINPMHAVPRPATAGATATANGSSQLEPEHTDALAEREVEVEAG